MEQIIITSRAVISTLFKAANTNFPIPTPNLVSIPGAWNFSHASIKLMAHTNPIQTNMVAIATLFNLELLDIFAQ
ncbi:MAG: hypothetical protein AAFO07_32325 [Bacteroidota bacterium]